MVLLKRANPAGGASPLVFAPDPNAGMKAKPKRSTAKPVSYKDGDGDGENKAATANGGKPKKLRYGDPGFGQTGDAPMHDYYSLKLESTTPGAGKKLGGGGGGSAGAATTLKKPYKLPSVVEGSAAAVAAAMPRVGTLGLRKQNNLHRRPLHDPLEDNALVLYAPEELTEQEKLNLKKSSTLGQDDAVRVHVVVDPRLCKILRPHQREGVRFLYECTTGNKVENYFGCIMADEMGLGKTLQCITLLWTLLRQSPVPGKPTIEKAIIVCPSSLVRNWANELIKWLGPHAITPLACDGKLPKEKMKRELNTYMNGQGRNKVYHVLIISYETLRMYSGQLKQTEIGLMLCDEGHRLKNSQNQTFGALNELNVRRRVILSGTPIQNDLTEYFSLLNFANPGLLGSPAEFRKKYELPILRGRDALASDADRARSEYMLSEMLGLASKVIIRRTADLLSKYLPVKFDHVVFVKMTPLQIKLYNAFMTSKLVQQTLSDSGGGGGGGQMPLKQITTLKKLCNHPNLVQPEDIAGFHKMLPADYDLKKVQPIFSGKLFLLEKMLREIKATTDDKVVLISNYTQTLDLFEQMCRGRGWGSLRLDGTMTISKRAKLVDTFNDPQASEFVFLLSSKAGGCGLNLVGANRLVLFDPDWNPANDGQALARVWRDGQGKDCFLYRLIATGSIEEKIFQRQCHKQSLSDCVVDEDTETSRHFSSDDLRELFKLNLSTLCETHDTYKCKRCVMGRQVTKPFEIVADETEKAEEEEIRKGYAAPEEGIVGLDTDHATPRPVEPADGGGDIELEEDDDEAGAGVTERPLQHDGDGAFSGAENELVVSEDDDEETIEFVEKKKKRKSRKGAADNEDGDAVKEPPKETKKAQKAREKAEKVAARAAEDAAIAAAPKREKGHNASSRKKNDMSNWNHWSEVELEKMPDTVLKKCGRGLVSFVFQTKSHEK